MIIIEKTKIISIKNQSETGHILSLLCECIKNITTGNFV
jgi:hypothetical protein